MPAVSPVQPSEESQQRIYRVHLHKEAAAGMAIREFGYFRVGVSRSTKMFFVWGVEAFVRMQTLYQFLNTYV